MANPSIQYLLQSLAEGEITFLPTYKFDIKTDVYYNSSKQRVPSFTDRILLIDNPEQLKLLSYQAIRDVRFSDHKPVIALFEVRTKLQQSD